MDDVLKRLQMPAIGLLIVGLLNGAGGVLSLLSGVMRLAGMGRQDNYFVANNETEAFGMMIGTLTGYGIAFLSFILSPVIVYASLQMMKGKRLGLAKTASVLVMLPLTACCFIVGIPIGAWSLYVLSRPDVKDAFSGKTNHVNINPPQPPNF